MEIQASSHAEYTAAVSTAPEKESPQKLKPEKNKLGVFAKILAGLSGRGHSTHSLQEHGAYNQGLSPAGLKKAGTGEHTEGDGKRVSADAGEAAALFGGKGKVSRQGKAAAMEEAAIAAAGKTVAGKPGKAGDIEPEQSYAELSEQEKNVLLAVGHLAGRSGENAADDSARLNQLNQETASDAVTITNTEQTLTAGTTAFTASVNGTQAASESGKNLNSSEKAKTRADALATADEPSAVAADVAGKSPHAAAETKKADSTEKEGKSKLEEVRSREKRRGVTFDVQDFRGSGQSENSVKENSVQLRTGGEAQLPGEGSNDITLELRLSNQGQDSSTAVTSWETKSGQAFEDLLARELHQNFNNDIVRHASVALRDNNEGTIRLALKPESLGNVKIHLEMAENKITGRIVVESEEALRAFEREIASLEKAFRESGFDGANLEMSLASDGRGANHQWREAEASQFLSGQIAASRYDAEVERIEMPLIFDVFHQGATAINVFA